ncbi:MAG: xanthine dehydrogenase family protein molybdopterin-binding subunit, partial [Pseudomonadota bacterium]
MVLKGSDVAQVPPIGFRMTRVPGLEPFRQPILAQDRVRYVGEPIAVVIGETMQIAEDAADLVFADIEELDPLMDATRRPCNFLPGVSTEAATIEKSTGNVDAALADAAHVIELELRIDRHTGVPLETRGALAVYDTASDRVDLFGAAKVPHANRTFLADMLDWAPERLHLHECHVGGGFGVRGELYPEDVLICLAASQLGRPVKWIEDRREHLMATNHSRDQTHKVRVGFDDSGYVLAVDDEFWLDQGAYVRTHAATVPDLTAAMLPGPYQWPAYCSKGHVRLTNKTPAGTYRAPGRFESTFVRERILDAVGQHRALDPAEVRRRNLITKAQIPFCREIDALGTPVVYDAADFEGLLEKLLIKVEYQDLQAQLAARRQGGEYVGLGLGYFVEKSGLGPFDDVAMSLNADGELEVVTGAASVGQGLETAIAQIVAEVLPIDHKQIRIVHGQTDKIARGMGAFASRVTVMTGSAATLAARKLLEQLMAKAAELLQQPVEQLILHDGIFAQARATPLGPSLSLREVVMACAPVSGIVQAEATFQTDHMTYPYGIHLVVARLDPETMDVRLERFVVAYDVGRAVNPMLIEGQIVGGVAQGLGGALLEAFHYDDNGQPLATSFADYLMPTLMEMPKVELLLTEDAPSPINPLGVKGAGEGGTNAAGAAIAAAVDAALGRPGLVRALPVTPDLLFDAWHRAG